MRSELRTPPTIPWQVTGNHWLSLPCIHPADGSIHAVGLLSSTSKGAVEFAGGTDFENGHAPPLLKLVLRSNGEPLELGSQRMAWQRVFEWLPTFSSTVGDLVIRGTVFAPYSTSGDLPGFIYAISLENRGNAPASVAFTAEGTLGARLRRIRTAREFNDDHNIEVAGDVVTLWGTLPGSEAALAIAGDGMTAMSVDLGDDAAHFALSRTAQLGAGEKSEIVLYCAAAPEPDGAKMMLTRLRSIGWAALAEQTRTSLMALQQTTGITAADRLVNRHLMFAFFYAVGRSIDDSRFYVVRSRSPWCEQGVTVNDYEALMWVMPAVQLADPTLAHDILMRICDLHGYAPGRGVNYMEGTPFDRIFCLDAAAAYPVAIDRYVAQTGDDRVVDDAAVAEALYAAFEEINASKHPSLPLYRTAAEPSGLVAQLPYTLHGNALVAEALEILKQTLDEKTAESVPDPEALRASVFRHFATDNESSRTLLWTAVDLLGATSQRDDPVGSVFWLPLYHMMARDDSIYRRTVRRVQSATENPSLVSIAERCAMLMGPDAAQVLEWLRRADLDGGLAAEFTDSEGLAVGNGGDASLSALVAYSVWYAVSVLGVPAG